jgi:prepilin-type N-terminal cleavage/methylation domain-containing protein
MTMYKEHKRGFTLVEAMVVSVLVAVLTAVAIKLYGGYVVSQRQQTVDAVAETAATAANTYERKTGQDPPDAASLNLYLPDLSKYTITIDGTNDSVVVVENKHGTRSSRAY